MHEVSPIWIPILAMLIPICGIFAGVGSSMYYRKLKSEERLAMLSRGVPLAEIEAYLRSSEKVEVRAERDPVRSLGNARRAAIVLIAVGFGLIFFSMLLAHITEERHVLAIAAAGVIPLAIGAGFLVDYWLQKKDMVKFGLLAEEEKG